MGKNRVRLNDKWFRIVGIPFISFMSHVIFFNENHMEEEEFSYWQIWLISVCEAIIVWEANRLVLLYFYNRYPHIRDSRQRITGLFLGCLLMTILVRYLNIWFYDQTLFWGYLFPPEGYWYNILIAVLYVMIFAGIYEGVFYFRQWKKTFAETEELKRENLQTELASLKAQINPHFLFNNLGSLTGLIMEDQHAAVVFVEELAAVYRYLLQANEKDLATLKEELRFADHYFHLLKIRFGEGILLKHSVDKASEEMHLPPLTLQLLLENAIKHNSVMPERPLLISIETRADGYLLVRNNRQKRNTLVVSDKTGLRNIRAKYRLMNKGEVTVEETDAFFEVAIPLIKTPI